MDMDIQAIELSKNISTYIAAIRVGHGPRSLVLVSAYFKYNVHTSAFIDKLRTILEDGAETTIGADTNGHSPRWHSRDLNQRGRVVEDLIDDFNLSVINTTGNIDTYARPGMGSSNIDVTLSTQGAARGVTGWLVSDETDSDHRLLSYKVDLAAPRVRHENKRFDVKREDWDLFAQELARKALTVQSVADKNEHASTLTDAIIAAATKAIPVKAGRRWAICRQPWWTDRLTSMRKLLNRSKRLGLMQNDRPTYNRQRNEYLHEIRRSKMESWKHASEDINVNTWGKAFRYAKNGPRRSNVTRSLTKADGTPTETVDDTMDVLLDTCCVPTIVCA